jgi:hypothetical protein
MRLDIWIARAGESRKINIIEVVDLAAKLKVLHSLASISYHRKCNDISDRIIYSIRFLPA